MLDVLLFLTFSLYLCFSLNILGVRYLVRACWSFYPRVLQKSISTRHYRNKVFAAHYLVLN